MTKSKVMPTAKLIGAPLSRLAFTYIFPINNPACPECYTIGLRVYRLTLTHVRPLSCIGESDQMPTCFLAFAYLYIFFSRYLQGFAYLLQRHCLLLQRCDQKKGYVTPVWNRCSLFSRQVLHTLWQWHKLQVQKAMPYLENFIHKKVCNAFFKCSFCIFSTKVLLTIFSANLWIE